MSTVKNIFNANKNARQNAQLKKSGKIKTGLAAGLGTTTAAGGAFAFFYGRHLMNKKNTEIEEANKKIEAAKQDTAKAEDKINVQTKYITASKEVEIKAIEYNTAKTAAETAAKAEVEATNKFNEGKAAIETADAAKKALDEAKAAADWDENSDNAKKLIEAEKAASEKAALINLQALTDELAKARLAKKEADDDSDNAHNRYKNAIKDRDEAEKAYTDLMENEKKEREEAEKAKAESDKKDDDKKDDDKKNKKKNK